MAVVYARGLARWGIETSIIVPDAFIGGTNHFAHSGRPADKARVAEFRLTWPDGLYNQVRRQPSSMTSILRSVKARSRSTSGWHVPEGAKSDDRHHEPLGNPFAWPR
jgi:hypothetical protein